MEVVENTGLKNGGGIPAGTILGWASSGGFLEKRPDGVADKTPYINNHNKPEKDFT